MSAKLSKVSGLPSSPKAQKASMVLTSQVVPGVSTNLNVPAVPKVPIVHRVSTSQNVTTAPGLPSTLSLPSTPGMPSDSDYSDTDDEDDEETKEDNQEAKEKDGEIQRKENTINHEYDAYSTPSDDAEDTNPGDTSLKYKSNITCILYPLNLLGYLFICQSTMSC